MKLNEFVYKVNKPCLFKNILKKSGESNEAAEWTLDNLASVLGEERLLFRMGDRLKENSSNRIVQFENECSYVDATLSDFLDWTRKSKQTNGNGNASETKKLRLENVNGETDNFGQFNTDDHWAYADYKYMIDFLDSENKIIEENCIDWCQFGFEERNAYDSTMWVGSSGAYTPCHYDTYGYNLVAQIHGKKRWILFSKEDSEFLYPSRIPFEESTVYSEVNIKRPDLKKFPKYQQARPYVIDLEPGDVLYVPHHWWHFVECLSDSLSINTWVELDDIDDKLRVKEILTKTILQSQMESNVITFEKWINPSENYTSQTENLDTIRQCLQKYKTSGASKKEAAETAEDPSEQKRLEELLQAHPCFSRFIESVDFDQYVKQYTLKPEAASSNADASSDATSRNDNLVLELSKVVTSPVVMDKILELFLAKNL